MSASRIGDGRYSTNMKRTNVVLDEHLLEEATRALGQKTYSATINFALQEALRIHKVQGLMQFFGKGLWRGNLTAMREDRHQGKLRRC
jgi:Arc/MetJ family transcription regulator